MSPIGPSPSAANPRRFRWRRLAQFRLRTLLIVTTIIALALGWWSYRARQQRQAVAASRDFRRRCRIARFIGDSTRGDAYTERMNEAQPTIDKPARSTRRRFQFGLRRLLIVMTLAAVCLAVSVPFTRYAVQEYEKAQVDREFRHMMATTEKDWLKKAEFARQAQAELDRAHRHGRDADVIAYYDAQTIQLWRPERAAAFQSKAEFFKYLADRSGPRNLLLVTLSKRGPEDALDTFFTRCKHSGFKHVAVHRAQGAVGSSPIVWEWQDGDTEAKK